MPDVGSTLRDSVDMPTLNSPPIRACGLTSVQILERAENIRQQFTADFSVPSSISEDCDGVEVLSALEAAVIKIGGSVEFKPLNSEEGSLGGAIRVRGLQDFTIYHLSGDGPTMRLWNLAHELGHYFLHFLPDKTGDHEPQTSFFVSNFGTTPADMQANWFAMAFLMPRPQFCKRLAQLRADNVPDEDLYAALAADFGVWPGLAREWADYLAKDKRSSKHAA